MSKQSITPRKPIVLSPGEGRKYPMGRISAVFKADEEETESRYAVSEWWLEPRTQGPGSHSHDEDDLFYVIEGVMSIRVGEEWFQCAKGAFVLVPGGVTHDFENRGSVRAGILNFSSPGPFEPEMPGIAEWFAQNPPKDTDVHTSRQTGTVHHDQPMRVIREAQLRDASILFTAEQAVASVQDGLLVSVPGELIEQAFVQRIREASEGVGKYLVVESSGRIVGHASLVPLPLRAISHVVRLDICIHRGHEGQGHGRALLDSLITWARENPQVHKIELQVRSGNERAVNLYRAAGFVEEGRLRDRVRLRGGQYVDDIVMGLLVSGEAS